MSTRKPSEHDTTRRMMALAWRILEGRAITIRWIMDTFGVSLATAKRDMVLIEATLPVEATRHPHPTNPSSLILSLKRRDGEFEPFFQETRA